MASDLLGMASSLRAMASNLLAASDVLPSEFEVVQPKDFRCVRGRVHGVVSSVSLVCRGSKLKLPKADIIDVSQ